MHRKMILMSITLGGLLLALALTLALSAPRPVAAQGGDGGSSGGAIPDFVGSDACGDCHSTIADQHELHGHNWILNRVEDGQPPDYPFDQTFELPEGYTWEDVSFVVGGWRWRAHFLDQEGYFITGVDENAATQWNFPLIDERAGETIVEGNWAQYHAGEEEYAYSCARCHTTGYNYNPSTHQDDLPGIEGAWVEEGVQCEQCHGPGSLHVEEPIRVTMQIDRSSGACAQCHYRGAPNRIEAVNGFNDYHNQYDEIQSSPHAALECIDCHNPHQSTQYVEEDVNPNRGMVNSCTNCHFDQPSIEPHEANGVTCVDCHMAPMTVSGSSSTELLWADVNSHMFQINTNPNAPQFTEDGEVTYPYITVQYVCTRCHSDWSVETMADLAAGYHEARR